MDWEEGKQLTELRYFGKYCHVALTECVFMLGFSLTLLFIPVLINKGVWSSHFTGLRQVEIGIDYSSMWIERFDQHHTEFKLAFFF